MKDLYFIFCMIMVLSLPMMIAGTDGIAIICLQIFFLGLFTFASEWLDE